MKKTILAATLGLAVAAMSIGTAAHAETTTVNDGKNTQDVTINGTLGADNTDPDAVIPEGSDSWINVTLDTATIFYNTKSSNSIESPKYTITNNSGRPVTVVPSAIKQTNSVDITSLTKLAVDFTRGDTTTPVSTTLVTSGTPAIANANTLTLGNKSGQLVKGDAANSSPTNNAATFAYSGTAATSSLTEAIKPTFTMTLTFKAVSWS